MIFFGAGQVAEKELQAGTSCTGIVDNNSELVGSSFYGHVVRSPEDLRATDSEILVCTSSVSEVLLQLSELDVGRNQIKFSDYLGDMVDAYRLENFDFKGYISCGLPSTAKSLVGGGIYQITERHDVVNIEKIFEGNTHGLIQDGDFLCFTAQGEGVVRYSVSEGKVADIIPIPSGLRPHGLRILDGEFFVACSMGDKVLQIDPKKGVIRQYLISDKIQNHVTAQHHCNDLWVTDQSIYVSMFSISGNWKRGLFDGGVVEIDRKSGRVTPVITGLKMPHNICEIEGNLVVLDSYRGNILGADGNVLGTLNGFVRGFDAIGDVIVVGESKNRNISKLSRGSNLSSLDSRITLINPISKICRSVPLPRTISEIHSIVAV